MTVTEFLAAEQTRDVLRASRKANRITLRRARRLVRKHPYNIVGSARLLRWAVDRYGDHR
jgi:hypothetical protein